MALLAVALGGCSGGTDVLSYLTPGKIVEPPPLVPGLYPDKYRAQIADYMRGSSTDNPGRVKDAFIGEPVLKPVAGSAVPLYVTCVRYNPRNNANQFTGSQSKVAIFLGGKLSQFLPGTPDMCAGLAYQRYPEIEAMLEPT
jgi:hypothetical protein